MDQSLTIQENSSSDPLSSLQAEISELQAELEKVKKELNVFETEIRAKLDREIARIQELTILYKKQKREKKEKRLEQKKRGKNYKEPKQVNRSEKIKGDEISLSIHEQKELKRIYKEAIVQVHPDKIDHKGEVDKIQRATLITTQLNAIYKSGDLEELINFYQYIILGNELSEKDKSMENTADPKARLLFLRRKKETLIKNLEELKASYIYNVLTTYENPLSFIEELHQQFKERIVQLEKRTRIDKKNNEC
jgi:hypothetical protein